jgi:hypothetical protein
MRDCAVRPVSLTSGPNDCETGWFGLVKNLLKNLMMSPLYLGYSNTFGFGKTEFYRIDIK